MKTRPLLLLALLATPALSQEPAPPLPPGTVEKTVTETTSPGQTTVEETTVVRHGPPATGFDPRRQLSTVPVALPADPDPAPGTKRTTETTTTTTTHAGGRVYNTERSVVVVEGRELPYVTIPVLFVKETAELLDSQSRAALDQTALAISEVLKAAPDATFDIEGHTSTDGAEDMNLTLSGARAQRIYDELTRRYHISPSALSAHGYGESYPKYPNGTEAEMTLDRRVLVVRSR